MAVIYRITNMANGKYYIGSAESYERRRWQHVYELKRGKHKNPRLQAAWNKYGEEMFVFEILETVQDAEQAFDVENRYLHQVVGLPDCYNINIDAHKPRLGKTHSEETKAKIRANRVPPAGEAHYRYGKTVSEETKAKIGAAQKGKPKTPGRTVSEEGRAKIRAAAQAGHYSHWKGRTHTQEAREKMAKPIYVQKPDGSQETYPSLSYIRDNLGISVATTIRACKSGKPIQTGTASGWRMSYEPIEAVTVPVEYADLPRTRQLAKEQGAKYYFTGEPCEHGHIAPRIVKGTCTECRKVDWQKRNEANKGKPKSEASKAAGRRYYEKKKLAAAQANCHNALTGVSGVADGPGRRHADSSTPTCM
jgi:group I intron endonuclease